MARPLGPPHLATMMCLATLLAGCVIPGFGEPDDESRERLMVDLVTRGPFDVSLPVPLAADGTTLAQWLDAVEVTGDARTGADRAHGAETLRIEGGGDVSGDATVQRGPGDSGYAEQYLDARWSTADDIRAQNVTVWIERADAPLQLTIGYEARSSWCGRHAMFVLETTTPISDEEAGWFEAIGQDVAECT